MEGDVLECYFLKKVVTESPCLIFFKEGDFFGSGELPLS